MNYPINYKQAWKLLSSNIPASLLKYLLLISTSGIALITFLLFLNFWQLGNRLISGITDIFNATPATPEVDVSTIILQQIRQASELTTSVFVMETVVPTSQERKVGDFVLATTKLLYIAHGEVRAGIDLTKLTKDNINIKENRIEIQLPAPQILDSKIDVNRSKVYDYNRGFLGLGPDVAPQLQDLAQKETLKTIVTTACNQGFLQQANRQAETSIQGLLNLAGYQEIYIKTQPPAPDACKI